MNEFQIIKKYFTPLTMGQIGACALTDDAAVIDIPTGHELVITSDTLNAGTHFFDNSPPDMIAHKTLRTNLSDLASMGATPLSYQLNITFPEKPPHEWLSTFTNALINDQKQYNIYCSGGDTTSTKGPLSISITALGLVKKGQAWKRINAQKSDKLVVTDFVGDAWIGLQILLQNLNTDDNSYFVDKFYAPPVNFINNNNINACIDISDGLLADIKHICSASGLGAQIEIDSIPFSPPAQKLLDANTVTKGQLITGGDDYILAMSIPSHIKHDFYEIGNFSDTISGLSLTRKGHPIEIKAQSGWTHF